MRTARTIFLVLLILVSCWDAAAKKGKPAKPKLVKHENRYAIHILTMDPGEELFARFGHIAVLVEDKAKKTKKVYNFGTFDFSDSDLRFKYARGFLRYWLSSSSYRAMVARYRDYNRTLVKRTLNLSQAEARLVAHRLAWNARPRHREYDYRHYVDNCCTRIRDLLDDVTGGAIYAGRDERPTGRTFRDWTRRALEGLPLVGTVIVFSLGPAVDVPITRWQEQFLPEVLSNDLDRVRFGPDRRRLVARKQTIIKHKGPAPGSGIHSLDLAVVIALFSLLVVGLIGPIVLARRAERLSRRLLGGGMVLWGLLSGLGGVVLVLFWAATTHYDTHYNENLIPMLPLHLWLLGPAFMLLFKGRLGAGTARFVGWYSVAALGLILIGTLLKLGPLSQDNFAFIGFAALCNALVAFSLWRLGLWTPRRPAG
jgi:hypothetical protein